MNAFLFFLFSEGAILPYPWLKRLGHIMDSVALQAGPIEALPFVSGAGQTVNLWDARETGAWELDNALGRQHADELLTYMADRNAPCALGFVVCAMMGKGRYGGIEAGFFSRIGQAATL